MADELAHFKELEAERWTAHRQEHELLRTAHTLAYSNMERRLEEMNQFRAQIAEERRNFVTWGTLAAAILGLVALFGLIVAYYKH